MCRSSLHKSAVKVLPCLNQCHHTGLQIVISGLALAIFSTVGIRHYDILVALLLCRVFLVRRVLTRSSTIILTDIQDISSMQSLRCLDRILTFSKDFVTAPGLLLSFKLLIASADMLEDITAYRSKSSFHAPITTNLS